MFNKFSSQETMKNKIKKWLIIASPLILFFLFVYYNKNDYDFSIIKSFSVSLVLPPIIFYFYHLGGSHEEKTGRSFRSKNGEKFDEYETVHSPDKPMDDFQNKIMKVYLILGLLIFYLSTTIDK